MMTIITRARIKEGAEPAWDQAFGARAAAARTQPGFVAVQLAIPLDAPNERVIIGTWETRSNWEAWHNHEAFRETRRQLEEVDDEKVLEHWHEVILHEHR